MKFSNTCNFLKIVIITITLVSSICLSGTVSAAGTAIVTVSTPTSVNAGQQFTIDITVQPNNSIAGVQYNFSFNPSLVTVNSITEGNLLKQGSASTYFSPGQINNTAGTITAVVGAIISPGQSVSTSGTFATITLTAKTISGTCPLSLSNVVIGDINAQSVPLQIVNGQVTITVSNQLSVSTNTASNITISEATLNGNLINKGSASSITVSFEYGLSTSYGSTVAGVPATLTTPGTFIASVSGLTPNTLYHYRAKVVGTSTVYGSDQTFTTLASTGGVGGGGDGGGGGGGWGGGQLQPISGVGQVTLPWTLTGYTLTSVTVTSEDGKCTIIIPPSTLALNKEITPLGTITCNSPKTPTSPPTGKTIIAEYELGPSGATFNPPITVTIKYDPASLSTGVTESSLILAFYDSTSDQWVNLDSITVDTVSHTISGKTSHFTIFGIISEKGILPTTSTIPTTPVSVPMAQTPAAFTVSDLLVLPVEVDAAKPVTISILVTNTGDNAGSYDVILKIDDKIENTKKVILSGKATERVVFTVKKEMTGIHAVNVDGMTGSYTIKETSVSKPELSLLGVLPSYDSKTGKISSARLSFWMSNLSVSAAVNPVLIVGLDGNALEEVTGLSIIKSEEEGITRTWDYIPSNGWKSGVYVFHVELVGSGGIFYNSEEQSLNVKPGGAIINWSVLLIIISVGFGVSVIVVAIAVFRKRDMYRGVITPPNKMG